MYKRDLKPSVKRKDDKLVCVIVKDEEYVLEIKSNRFNICFYINHKNINTQKFRVIK